MGDLGPEEPTGRRIARIAAEKGFQIAVSELEEAFEEESLQVSEFRITPSRRGGSVTGKAGGILGKI